MMSTMIWPSSGAFQRRNHLLHAALAVREGAALIEKSWRADDVRASRLGHRDLLHHEQFQDFSAARTVRYSVGLARSSPISQSACLRPWPRRTSAESSPALLGNGDAVMAS
jgi:hypothetical protein